MEITINGEEKRFDAPLSVAELLQVLELQPQKIAVERNREIVPKSLYDQQILVAGDQVEIVQFVGGG